MAPRRSGGPPHGGASLPARWVSSLIYYDTLPGWIYPLWRAAGAVSGDAPPCGRSRNFFLPVRGAHAMTPGDVATNFDAFDAVRRAVPRGRIAPVPANPPPADRQPRRPVRQSVRFAPGWPLESPRLADWFFR